MRIYLLNTSKPYDENEDSYAGDWFTCPVDYEEVRERLHMQEGDTYAIEDYELPFPIREDTPLWEINANCRMVQEMEETPLYDEMKACMVESLWRCSPLLITVPLGVNWKQMTLSCSQTAAYSATARR